MLTHILLLAVDNHGKQILPHLLSSFYKLFLSFLLDNNGIEACGKSYYETEERLSSGGRSLLGELAVRVLPPGLAAFRLFRQTKDSIWLKRGQKCKKDIQVWVEQGCRWNFEHKFLLLAAEESHCLGDNDVAKEYYKNAIAAAQTHKFLNDECFALEAAANFYFENGDLPSSLDHFRLAHVRYYEWGACAKANQLFQHIIDKFALRQ